MSVWLVEGVGTPGGDDVWVDEEAGIIHNVLVLGEESPNIPLRDGRPIPGVTKGTRYTRRAFATGAQVMEGAKVRKNHPDRKTPHAERNADDDLGVLRNCREVPNGVRAQYHYNRAHPFNAQLVEDVKRKLGQRGFSPNAVGVGSVKDGYYLVEEIAHVRSVDIVSDPATTVTLWNSKDTTARPAMTVKFRDLIRSQLPRLRGPKLKAAVSLLEADYMADKDRKPGELVEDDAMLDPNMGDVPVEAPAEGGDPDEALKAGFTAAAQACIEQALSGDMDPTEALKKLKELLTTHAKLASAAAPEPAPVVEDEAEEAKKKDDEAALKESVDPAILAKLAELEKFKAKHDAKAKVVALCESLSFKPTDVQLEGLAELRESLWKPMVLDIIKQTRGPRSSGPGKAPEPAAKPADAKPAATAEEFLASISR